MTGSPEGRSICPAGRKPPSLDILDNTNDVGFASSPSLWVSSGHICRLFVSLFPFHRIHVLSYPAFDHSVLPQSARQSSTSASLVLVVQQAGSLSALTSDTASKAFSVEGQREPADGATRSVGAWWGPHSLQRGTICVDYDEVTLEQHVAHSSAALDFGLKYFSTSRRQTSQCTSKI